MIALLQRVDGAAVEVDSAPVARIDRGLLVFLGVQQGDAESEAARIVARLLGYRVFPDASGRMNRSLSDLGGGLLLVPQFTLAADTRRGQRPSFSSAAPPVIGERLFNAAVQEARRLHETVEAGVFGADMKVSLVNDGPVTFWLEVRPQSPEVSI